MVAVTKRRVGEFVIKKTGMDVKGVMGVLAIIIESNTRKMLYIVCSSILMGLPQRHHILSSNLSVSVWLVL